MTALNDNIQGCCNPRKNDLGNNNVTNKEITKQLPVVIIGAGPVGLAAAAHLASRRQSFILLEAGMEVGSNIKSWGHIRLFSPWRYNIDKAAMNLLNDSGWVQPELENLPTGQELVEQYLRPLSNVPEIQPFVYLNTKVLSIGRKDVDKMKTANRENVR